jgi:C-terminal processing protease CtpA/Prc
VKIDAKITPAFLVDNVTQVDRRKIQIQDESLYFRKTKQLVYDKIPGLLVWKLPTFEIDENLIEKSINRAKSRKALILDLRGNDELSELMWKSRILSNNAKEMVQNLLVNRFAIERKDLVIKSLKRFFSNLFGKKIQLGELRDRKKVTILETESTGKDYFVGDVVVLIDSETGSASEIAARILQLEKRAKVIGDVSAGSAMTTRFFSYKAGIGYLMPFGINVPNAEFVTVDGNRLENVGITPDEKILPTALDLLNNRDPGMTRAAEILGFRLTPEEAGKIFP